MRKVIWALLAISMILVMVPMPALARNEPSVYREAPMALQLSSACVDPLVLPGPETQVSMRPTINFINSYFTVSLGGLPEPSSYSIRNGEWPGWCASKGVVITQDSVYSARVYSSLSASSSCAAGAQWDKINYILNHKVGTWEDVQIAIWQFTVNVKPAPSLTPNAQIMVAAANAQAGFCPLPGQIAAVILCVDPINGQAVQPVFIEVQVPFTNPGTGTPGYWKNHPEAWPVQRITIGNVEYTKDQAIAEMSKPDGDKTYTLFRALVCAKLNVLIGNDPRCVASTIRAADSWMATYGPVGSKVKASSAAWRVGEPLYLTLDNYNNGLLCAPHRG